MGAEASEETQSAALRCAALDVRLFRPPTAACQVTCNNPTALTMQTTQTLETEGDFTFTGSTIRRKQRMVPKLYHLVFRTILANIHSVPTLAGMPEEVVAMLLWRVMEKGILNPSLGRLFYYSGHESVQKWLEANVDIDAGTIGYKGRMSCH